MAENYKTIRPSDITTDITKNITAILHALAVSAPMEVRDIIDTTVNEIERLRQIEALALEILAEKASGIELTLNHTTCKSLLELAVSA